MTEAKDDPMIKQLEQSIIATLKDKKTTARDRNAAIANGIKLAQILHKIGDGEEGEFFGGSK
jgi:hypothetical protein